MKKTSSRSTAKGPAVKSRIAAKRGFAAMSPEQRTRIARMGGETISRNRAHMAEIGMVGGHNSHGGRGSGKVKSAGRSNQVRKTTARSR